MNRVLLVAVLVLSGCTAAPVIERPAVDTRAALAAIRNAGVAAPDELEVRPLADPQFVDLRELAAAHERGGRVDAAVAALDEALAISPGDPGLLQERAELAVLQGWWLQALEFAQRSHGLGPKVGPLCRRQQELQVQVALAQAVQGDASAGARAEAARRARDACTVTPPPRY